MHNDVACFLRLTHKVEYRCVLGKVEVKVYAEFIKGASERGLLNLKGHKIAGGMRASMYNAMPIEGAKALLEYMKEFEARHHV